MNACDFCGEKTENLQNLTIGQNKMGYICSKCSKYINKLHHSPNLPYPENVKKFYIEIGRNEITGKINREVYQKYTEFCKKEGFDEIVSIEYFSKILHKYFNFEVIDKKIKGVKYRVYK